MKHVLLEMSNAGLVNNMKKYLEAKNNKLFYVCLTLIKVKM